MINKEYNIIETFMRNPWESLTFKQVKDISKNKSDNYIHRTLKKFVKENVLKEKRIGNVVLYSINLNVDTLNLIGFVAEHKTKIKSYLPFNGIQKIIGKIKTSFYIFIVTGSYAKNKQKKGSDMDVVVICDNKENPERILSQIRLEAETMIPEIHAYAFTESQFYEMLINKEENYGKETVRNALIITGAKQYYDILMRAIENGFKG